MENDSRFRLLDSSVLSLCTHRQLRSTDKWLAEPEIKSDFKPFDLDKIAQKSVRRFLLCPQDELDKKYQILMDFPTLSALKRISATT